jgi:Helicase associated domain
LTFDKKRKKGSSFPSSQFSDLLHQLKQNTNPAHRIINFFSTKVNTIITTMNSVFNNTYHMGGSFAGNSMEGGGKQKPSLSLQPDSLFSMALYDFEEAAQQEMMAPVAPQLKRPGHFYPVDEYKDLSLREILEISDDLIFDSNDNNNNSNNNNNDVVHHHHNFGSHPMQMHVPGAIQLQHQHQHQQAPVMPRVEPQMIQSIHQQEVMTVAPSVVTPTANNNNDSATTTGGPSAQQLPNSDIDLSPKKKRRRSEDDDDSEDPTTGRRFRPYQAGQWSEKFEELCEYRERMGHCLVPHTFSENLALARWVKRQRYQFKLMREGKSSTMTEDRVRALEEIGFVWDSQGAAWGERLAELKEFRQEFIHCNVPSNFSENPQLATWVKCQRRQYKLHLEGKPSNMTPQRIGELEGLGFEWELRSYKKARTC